MGELPAGFLPDLRALRRWPELHGSLWREPVLVELTYGAVYRLVRRHVNPPSQVLDLGCGMGYMALELARDGCRVTAVDADAESIELARGALAADPLLRGREVLAYEVADIAEWQAPPGRFDVVVASRALHHVPDLEGVVSRMSRWLRPGGKLVCVDFAYDRFDRRCAAWLYQLQGLLQACGAGGSSDRLGDEPGPGIERVWAAWWQHHEQEHRLHTGDRLLDAFHTSFREQGHEWLPYLYWDVLEEVELAPAAAGAVARFVRNLEAHQITAGELPALLFSWIGQRGPGAARPTPQARSG